MKRKMIGINRIIKKILVLLSAFLLVACIFCGLPLTCRADLKALTLDVKSASGGKTILILGDSRTCAIINLMINDSEYEKLYFYLEDTKADAVFRKGDTDFVICSQGGGSFGDGALRNSKDRMLGIIENNPALLASEEIYLFNLFGINDADKNPYVTVSGYSAVNAQLLKKIPLLTGAYQFNIGPITEDGYIAGVGLSNEKIERFNKFFEKIRYAVPVDLYSYLTENGYDTVDDTLLYGEKTGIHYTDETTGKILKLIIALAKGGKRDEL